ncbi:MAG: L,D-transpeptidase [Candidatus Paracaedibacteraceae bacterium]|nr:L,D-transpeptidase [Candidatus Paracaedibacteraceae bacterium]
MMNSLIILILLSLPAFASIDSIEIIKHRHELNLIQDDKIIKSYTVSLGRQPQGRKVDRNDKRTPEGSYTIKRKLNATEYNKSLTINYPTPEETADATARGVDIGDHLCIHGMRSYLSYMPGFMQKLHRWVDWTAGCIALTDSEIDEIFEEVEVGTPVVIYE